MDIHLLYYHKAFTASVEGPIFLNETTSAYYCVLFDNRITTNEHYEVTFLFDNKEEPDVPRFNVTNSNDRVLLSEKYIIGKMRKQVNNLVKKLVRFLSKFVQHFFYF